MRYHVTIGGSDEIVEVDGFEGNRVRVTRIDEQGRPRSAPEHVSLTESGPTLIVTVGERRFWASQGSKAGRLELSSGAMHVQAAVSSSRERTAERLRRAKGKRAGASSITAPMPGRIVRILVQEGERVDAGQALIAIEAMKMQNELLAENAALVQRVSVKPGDSVEAGVELMRLTTIGGSPADSEAPPTG